MTDDKKLVASSTERKSWRRRVPTALVALGCVAALAAAITAAASPVPGLSFLPRGHWVFNVVTQLAVHIDGATPSADASVPVAGGPGSQVVQGPSSGYVVGKDRITVFGQSSLSVEREITPPADETPLAIEAVGGPYLVYRKAGKLVRLGDDPKVIPTDGRVADPVVTADGTLWLYKPDGGLICPLAKDATAIADCPARVDQGHTGSLTVVDDQPRFLDTTADVLFAVSHSGMGAGHPLGVAVPPDAELASSDVDGRVAIIDPGAHRMHLVDTRTPAADPVTVDLPEGDYAPPTSTGSVVAVVERGSGTVRTYDQSGRQRDERTLPKDSGGAPRVSKGEDNRVYVEGARGTDVLVVGRDGKVADVPVAVTPEKRGPEKAQPDEGTPPQPERDERAVPPPSQDRPADRPADRPERHQDKPDRPVVPASPPGAPPNVSATPGDASATVTWGAAASNRAAITGYRVTWRDGAGRTGTTTVDGSARSAKATGLTNGRSYTISVSAVNAKGRGPAASANPVVPAAAAAAPGGLTVSLQGTDATVRWTAPDMAGGTLRYYKVSATGQAGKNVTGTSTTYAGLTPNSTVTVTVRAVTRTPDGRTLTGAAATKKITVPGPVVTVTRGEQCDPEWDREGCTKMHVVLTGFAPDTTYNIYPHSDDPDYDNEGSGQTTDENGDVSFDAFDYFGVGHYVWVTVDIPGEDVESKHYLWEPV